MNYLKRFVRVFLMLTAVVVCLTMLPNQAEAATVASGTCGDNLTWVLDDYGTLTISGTGALNAPWWESPWNSYRGSIRSVFIENGVTSIGEYTFEGYPLEWVYISDSVVSIGYGAFWACSQLYDVTIGKNVTSIGDLAFADCSALWAINIPSKVTKIGSYAFYRCSRLESISLPAELTLISSEAFNGCTSLRNVSYQGTEAEKAALTIQWGNDPLNNAAWRYVQILGSGSCGENLTWELRDDRSLIIAGTGAMDDYGYWGTPWHNYMRDNNTFYYDSWNGEQYEIDRVVIEDGVTGIANGAFRNFSPYSDPYSKLAVRIPDSITELPENAFEGCYFGDSYSEVYLGNENNPYLVLCYAGSIWEYSHTIPETTRFIWSNAFREWNYDMYPEEDYNVYITDPSAWCKISFNGKYSNPMTLSNNVYLHILDANGNEVTDVVLDSTVTQIPQSAFRNASIKSITIPNGVTSISDYAFYYCNSLTDIDIPDGVTSIGGSAFYGCFNLTGIAIPDTVRSVGKNAFYGITGNTYDNAKYIGNEQNPYLVLASYTSSDTATKCTVHSAAKIISDGAFADCYALREVTIPNGVISIGASAFSHTELFAVTIPDSVTSIGSGAFSGCYGLTSVTMGGGVTHIGASAFMNTGLRTITIPESVESIGSSAFGGCWSLDTVTIGKGVTSIGSSAFNGTAITSVTIPDSVTSIGGYAFSDCYYLTSVTIGKGVNRIDNYMFKYCDRLTHAYYEGTSEQWGKIYSFNGGEWEEEWLSGIICLGDYPFVGINGDEKAPYHSLTEALAGTNGGYIRFNWSAQEDAAVAKDAHIDLNGCTLTGDVTIADGATLYVFDSATADYTADSRGKIVGTVAGDLARSFNTPDAYGYNYKYLALEEEENVWSFHRYYLTVKSVILQPCVKYDGYTGTAVDYRTQFRCNDLVAGNVTAYGTKLVGDNTVYADYMANGYTLLSGAGNDNAQRTWLSGTFKSTNTPEVNAANALAEPTVSAYITLTDGTEITSAGVRRSLQDMVAYANGATGLTDLEKMALGRMYDLFRDVLDSWTDMDISNIKQYAAELV